MNSPEQATAGGSRRFALVTGASSGIGRAIAVALSTAGFSLIVTARRREALHQTAAMMASPGACVACLECDLEEDGALADLVAQVRRVTDGRLALVVNCAGRFHFDSFAATPVAVLDTLYRLNFRAPYLLTQSLLPLLRADQGSVVFVNSTVALHAPAHMSAYNASKAALKALADTIRDEHAAEGLRVLSIFPGRTDTPMGAEATRREGRPRDPELLVQPEDVAAAVVGAVSLPPRAQVTHLQISPGRRELRTAPAMTAR